MTKFGYKSENVTEIREKQIWNLKNIIQYKHKEENYNISLFQYVITFITCFVVYIKINRRCSVILNIEEIIYKGIVNCHQKYNIQIYNIFLKSFRHLFGKYGTLIWTTIKLWNSKCIESLILPETNIIEEHVKESKILIDKLKEVNEDRKFLSQLLINTVEDNKNIKTELQLERVTKERLLKHIQIMNKQIKDSKSKYFNFQHLYISTHQENLLLKNRIKKLVKNRNEVESNLINLVKKVYQSKNSELLAYCSRFIVRTKDNFLNCDVNSEINTFLQNSPGSLAKWNMNEFSATTNSNFLVTELF